MSLVADVRPSRISLSTFWIRYDRRSDALANWVLGEPQELVAVGQDVPGGEVNGQVSMVLRHTGDAQSTINTTIMADTPTQAVLAGTHATLVIEGPFYTPGNLTLVSAGVDRHPS